MPVHGHTEIMTSYGLALSWGPTVPTDGSAGYAPGCIFVHVDGSAADCTYINEGSVTSCDFNALEAGAFGGDLDLNGALDLDTDDDSAFGADVNNAGNGGGLQVTSGGTGSILKLVDGSNTVLDVTDGGTSILNYPVTVADDTKINFGTGSDTSLRWDNTAGALVVEPAPHYLRALGLSDRFELKWVAGQRGKPGVNADIQNAAEATRMIADPDFEVLGTNAGSSSITYCAEGGIYATTAGADGDSVIVLPHLDANQSAWKQVTWGTDKETRWECVLVTNLITTVIIYAGLKLTNTDVVATDDDQAFFRYENGVNSGKWQAVSSIGGTDDAADSGVTVEASTAYHLMVDIQSDRTAKFYINGALVKTSGALTDTTDLIPYIGVKANGAAVARYIIIRGQAISRTAG